MSSICLSFVFNHQYEKNIPKLKKIYGERFSTIKFLSPFSDWNKDEAIIPIFETSIHFQGYFSQAYPLLPKDYDYYVFCADDLLLNPSLNEDNLINELRCKDSGYIKYLNPIWEHSFAWHKFEECNSFPSTDNIIPYSQYLPGRDELLMKYEALGFNFRNIGMHNFFGVYQKGITTDRLWAGIKYVIRNGLKRYVHYPLMEGYSDFIVVPKENLKVFCYYCGIFAAMNLWVDAAVATSLILSCDKIANEEQHNYKGIELWNNEDVYNQTRLAGGKVNNLKNIFSENTLYIHPVKLSSFN
jgi:hypothetical protein